MKTLNIVGSKRLVDDCRPVPAEDERRIHAELMHISLILMG